MMLFQWSKWLFSVLDTASLKESLLMKFLVSVRADPNISLRQIEVDVSGKKKNRKKERKRLKIIKCFCCIFYFCLVANWLLLWLHSRCMALGSRAPSVPVSPLQSCRAGLHSLMTHLQPCLTWHSLEEKALVLKPLTRKHTSLWVGLPSHCLSFRQCYSCILWEINAARTFRHMHHCKANKIEKCSITASWSQCPPVSSRTGVWLLWNALPMISNISHLLPMTGLTGTNAFLSFWMNLILKHDKGVW